ncbi:DNA_methylase domain-containing protein/Chromo domain-containing protein/BAH domain-containing protein [Cephalotus follicularis]|uniref:DNA (cytosine-5-)-methyltransferase n=1 Tax=Cephalotus follicularis TaxID=3775 RepID=A0A1Q3B7G2_CEPFO|nr:DNA_methylase domain-containing protein/Chromo domain-containing protein/BAH domain-containing protein [Cephalotus follicularis]
MGPPRKRKTEEEAEIPISSSEPKKSNPRKSTRTQPDIGHNEVPVTLLSTQTKRTQRAKPSSDLCFVGTPVPTHEAHLRWPLRYQSKSKVKNAVAVGDTKNGVSSEEEVLQARCHYTQAIIDGVLYNLGDDAYVKAEDGSPDYIARILELFETIKKEPYFKAQWFYRAEDTVIKNYVDQIESRRVFLSEIEDDNPLNCVVSRVKIAQVQPNMDLDAKNKKIPPCDLYYDMKYKLPYLTFTSLVSDNSRKDSDVSSTISSESGSNIINDGITNVNGDPVDVHMPEKPEILLLDLYSGCGAMSTGLCMGATLSGVKVVTRWAVDINSYACQSLKLNHPETEVRNEAAEDFLSLIKEWTKLCKYFLLIGSENLRENWFNFTSDDEEEEDDDTDDEIAGVLSEEFEVEKILAIRYGDCNEKKKPGLHFKVSWKGYGPSYDTWEPIEGLSYCKGKIKEFVTQGYKSNMLPLPGRVDFVCGGPPCQGVSGFNRFRNVEAPLEDVKNHQLVVFMDIVEYLKPKYILMENVVDILKFAGGHLPRYAVGRLVSMNYQTRLGMMAAGSYGVPQFRMRVFLWGAHPSKTLPQYPLPTHEVAANKGGTPNEFEEIAVGNDKNQHYQLERAIYLKDVLSDLPSVSNNDSEDERKYGTSFKTEFQKYIRLKRNEIVSYTAAQNTSCPRMLYDHRPLQLNEDDYTRVCHIPKKKGANFRDLPGVLVGPDNKVFLDPSTERVMLESGKPLVPDYAITFVKGRSLKPFGRVWWDETVGTVVTRAQPHNRAVLHPLQDRVLTIRENARLQGFPDCYQLRGSVKERYIQVGNAVAIPVALALGYTFGMAWQGLSDDQPLMTLPFKFPKCLALSSSTQIVDLDSD